MAHKLLNVGPGNPDKHLATTLAKITAPDEDRIYNQSEVHAVLVNRGASLNGGHSLDLVGHSISGVLQIGAWKVDKGGTKYDLLANYIKNSAPNVKQVRLLGCGTARNAGAAALADMRQALRTKLGMGFTVAGTTLPISAVDFGATGLDANFGGVSDRIGGGPVSRFERRESYESAVRRWFRGLAEFPGEQPEGAESFFDLFADYRLFPGERWEVVEIPDTTPLLGVLNDVYRAAPGLLARPDAEIIVPIDGRMYHRYTVLLDYEVVRTYPRHRPTGVFRQVMDRDALRDLVARARPVTPPRALASTPVLITPR